MYHMASMIQLYILPIECIYEFRVVLIVNSDHFLNSINRMVFVAKRIVFPVRYELKMYVLPRVWGYACDLTRSPLPMWRRGRTPPPLPCMETKREVSNLRE
jgi:hypothetical protein